MADVSTLLKSLTFVTPKKYVHNDPDGNDYVTARYVMNVLDAKVGPENWSDEYRTVDIIHRSDGTTRMSVECRLTVCGVTKADVGNGESLLSKQGKVFIEHDKTAYSNALKRAAVKFGIARDLYEDGIPDYGKANPAAAPTAPQPARADTDSGDAPTDASPPPLPPETEGYSPATFRKAFRQAVGRADGSDRPASEPQVTYLARLMSTAFEESPTVDRDRYAVLSWLTGRDITSTSQLTMPEASALISRIVGEDKNLSDRGEVELYAVYYAALEEQGQQPLFPDDGDNMPF